MIIKHFVSTHYSTNTFFLLSYNFKSWYEHEHDMLWIKDAPLNEINTNEKTEFFCQ
jgi:hypothetical protein